MIIAESNRLVIRTLEPEDSPDLYEFSQETCTKRELPDEVFDSLETTIQLVHELIENYGQGKFPIVYAIELKTASKLIGHLSLSLIDEHQIELGYAISERYQKNGYAYESLSAFIPYVKQTLRILLLYGVCKQSNEVSWRILEKLGFRLKEITEKPSFGSSHLLRIYTI
jgi:ribosomal-protein-alanine N-acetyltransferase